MKKKCPWQCPRRTVLVYTVLKLNYKFDSWLLQCFSLHLVIPFPWSVPSVIQLLLNYLGLPLVAHPGLHLSVCPIGHPLRLLCALGRPIQPCSRVFSTIMQPESYCKTFNAVVSTFHLDILGHPSALCFCNAYPCLQNSRNRPPGWHITNSDLNFVYPM